MTVKRRRRPPSSPRRTKATRPQGAGLRVPARILVVDGKELIRTFVGTVLDDEGHEVVTAPHGDAALAVLQRWSPDLILLGLPLVDMSGWDLAHEYYQTTTEPAPIVVLAPLTYATNRATQIDAAEVLVKPFQRDDLVRAVDRQLAAAPPATSR
ncbi:MAG: response regulator transcription factor [Chloroflexi bacterium]|nr:response regulator transcription factor [Chloroflexota bacterium]